MSKLKHTPGPWESGIKYIPYEYDFCYVRIPNGTTISISPALENEANARLIAAAPEMLDALIYFVKRVREGSIRSQKTYHMYIDIIEKATGMTIEEVLKDE